MKDLKYDKMLVETDIIRLPFFTFKNKNEVFGDIKIIEKKEKLTLKEKEELLQKGKFYKNKYGLDYLKDAYMEMKAEIRSTLGFPNDFDFRVFNSLVAIWSRNKDESTNEIQFTFLEICKMNDWTYGGDMAKCIKHSIEKMVNTNARIFKYVYIKEGEKPIKLDDIFFSLLDAFHFTKDTRDELYDSERNKVYFSEYTAKCISNSYAIFFDYEVYKNLDTDISKALYQKTFVPIHLAKNNGGTVYKKDYADICDNWLLIKKRKYLSDAIRQFQNHLNEMKKANLISDWNITKSKEKGTFIINFILSKTGNRKVVIDKIREIDKDIKDITITERLKQDILFQLRGCSDTFINEIMTEFKAKETTYQKWITNTDDEDILNAIMHRLNYD